MLPHAVRERGSLVRPPTTTVETEVSRDQDPKVVGAGHGRGGVPDPRPRLLASAAMALAPVRVLVSPTSDPASVR